MAELSAAACPRVHAAVGSHAQGASTCLLNLPGYLNLASIRTIVHSGAYPTPHMPPPTRHDPHVQRRDRFWPNLIHHLPHNIPHPTSHIPRPTHSGATAMGPMSPHTMSHQSLSTLRSGSILVGRGILRTKSTPRAPPCAAQGSLPLTPTAACPGLAPQRSMAAPAAYPRRRSP